MILSLLPQVDGEIYKAKLFYHPLPPASAPNSRATSATSRFNSQLDLTTGKRKLQDILYMWTHNFFVCHAHPFFSLNFSYKIGKMMKDLILQEVLGFFLGTSTL